MTRYDDIFETQLLTYLRLTGLKPGLVINFGQRVVKDGIHHVVNACLLESVYEEASRLFQHPVAG